MTFDEALDQVRELLQQRGRVTYRSLKLRYQLDDELLAGVTDELISAERVAVDEDGKVLVWVGREPTVETENRGNGETEPRNPTPTADSQTERLKDSRRAEGERRQLTVLFCDLVGSTALSAQLDPEELRTVVQAYQQTCAAVIRRYEGHLAQYLGDGVLVYFGYPVAHEDDAQRAVRTGLEIIAALQSRARQQAANTPLPHGRGSDSLQVRIGIHTGVVVISDIGSNEKREILALGETPNIAARLQGVAAPDTVVVSAATQRLVAGLFEYQDLGPQSLKGISTPLSVYRVLRESEAHSRFEAAVSKGLTPLVGREEELGLLRRRWEQARTGAGQVVLLSGEPGIGKSRLVQELKEHVSAEGATRIEFRCSPYHQNSALYPITEHLQRLLQFQSADTPHTKLAKLAQLLSQYRFPQAETLPLLAALFSLPLPEGAPPLSFSPQKQKQLTLEALVAWLLEETERAVVYCAWEDLHWADPSTLEILTLFLGQAPTARVLTLLTFRPEFTPPWGNRSHFSQITLSRLGRQHVETMVENVTGGKALPAEVVQHIVAKTDGVPLFIEELTKSVVEAVGATGRSPLQSIDIPATLQDSLMARLDRLNTAKELAQLGATIGREFSYEVLHAVSPLDEDNLQQGLRQLVEVELLYQRGLLPQARYIFKHALIQDTAYQSLLKSRRQRLHQQIAQVLEERFPETKETQPELVAHHYTEAGLNEQAIPYWQQAGQRAIQRSANVEAISHLTKGLELLKTFPDTPGRAQQELALQTILGPILLATKGFASPEVKETYDRALHLCSQIGETAQLFPILRGLWQFYFVRAECRTARELGEQLLSLAQQVQDPVLLVPAYRALGTILFSLGEFVAARKHLDQGIALYDLQQHRAFLSSYGADSGVLCLFSAAMVLWPLGYPDQALKRSREALILAQELSHPFSLAIAFLGAGQLHQFRRERQATQEWAETLITFSSEQGFPFPLAVGTILQGLTWAEQGQREEGIAQIHRGLVAHRATGAELGRPYFLAWLAETYGNAEQSAEGLIVLDEALTAAHKNEERHHEAELYRLKGELTLQQFQVQGSKFKVEDRLGSSVQRLESEAEECFLKAIEIAQRQQAKSLELRAVMSLVRLRQRQAILPASRDTDHATRDTQHATLLKLDKARTMLSEIYGWFTEGFDTKDLQEAKMLLDELSEGR